VSWGPGADHAQMFCGAVGVLWCARTAPAAPPRRGMLVRHVAGCCCGPDFPGKGWFPSSGVPRTRECRVPPRDDWCRWVGWWMDSGAPRSHGPLRGLGEKARVVPCQSPDFSCVWGRGLLPSSGVPRAHERRGRHRDDWCWWVACGVPGSHGPLRGSMSILVSLRSGPGGKGAASIVRGAARSRASRSPPR
jgi:hypothetical protein